MGKATTQQAKILNFCNKHGSITVRDMFVKLDINSPRKVVSEMRNSPFYTVTDIKESRVNRYGEKKTYKRYFIKAVQANG
jgi:hypothetical protein